MSAWLLSDMLKNTQRMGTTTGTGSPGRDEINRRRIEEARIVQRYASPLALVPIPLGMHQQAP
jgi:hypothetical protein